MSTWYITPSDKDLIHYGVLGMKWGVRRYQNANGSYTREGLKRYNQSKERYNIAKENYKINKTSNDAALLKASKKQLKSDYKQLKKDYKADKGRELYAQGKTVGEINTSPSAKASGLLIASGASAAAWALQNIPKSMPVRVLVNHPEYGKAFRRVTINGKPLSLKTLVVASGLGAIAVGSLMAAKNKEKIKNLRAYYGHSRTPVNHKVNMITSTKPNVVSQETTNPDTGTDTRRREYETPIDKYKRY